MFATGAGTSSLSRILRYLAKIPRALDVAANSRSIVAIEQHNAPEVFKLLHPLELLAAHRESLAQGHLALDGNDVLSPCRYQQLANLGLLVADVDPPPDLDTTLVVLGKLGTFYLHLVLWVVIHKA